MSQKAPESISSMLRKIKLFPRGEYIHQTDDHQGESSKSIDSFFFSVGYLGNLLFMTFIAHSPTIEALNTVHTHRIAELEKLLQGDTCMYIDFANVLPWQKKLGWNIDLKRLRQFFTGFQNLKSLKLYYGTLPGDPVSEKWIQDAKDIGFDLKTKDVKIMKKSIDASSISPNSPAILENFIRKPFLDNLKVSDIERLNKRLQELNNEGVLYLEDRKCNFDVEMGTDILLDLHFQKIQTFVIWSGDSDFYDIVKQLQAAGKNVYIFATARKVSRELSESGAIIYDIQKIRDFLCWKKQIKNREQAKGTPGGAPKH